MINVKESGDLISLDADGGNGVLLPPKQGMQDEASDDGTMETAEWGQDMSEVSIIKYICVINVRDTWKALGI